MSMPRWLASLEAKSQKSCSRSSLSCSSVNLREYPSGCRGDAAAAVDRASGCRSCRRGLFPFGALPEFRPPCRLPHPRSPRPSRRPSRGRYSRAGSDARSACSSGPRSAATPHPSVSRVLPLHEPLAEGGLAHDQAAVVVLDGPGRRSPSAGALPWLIRTISGYFGCLVTAGGVVLLVGARDSPLGVDDLLSPRRNLSDTSIAWFR